MYEEIDYEPDFFPTPIFSRWFNLWQQRQARMRHWELVSRTKRIQVLLAVTLVAFAEGAISPLAAQSTGGSLEKSDAFEIAFGMSFYGFDACGDAAWGDIFRKALVEKFESCPFSAAAKERFRRRIANQTREAKTALDNYIKEHGKLPDRPEGMKMSCAEIKQTREYMSNHALLERYYRGEIDADEVVREGCDMPAVPP